MVWMMVPVVSMLTGCATAPTRVYSGPELPEAQVVKISAGEREIKVGWSNHITEMGKIVSVDGEKMKGFMITKAIYVLPGRHEIVAQVHGASSGPSLGALPSGIIAAATENKIKKWNTPLIFNAEAGKSYIIRFDSFNTPESRFVYVYWVEETQTGKYVCGWRPDAAKK
jgi:hypothetical protein